jgi:hypothetical protein
VVIASISDGAAYANNFRRLAKNNGNYLEPLLAEVWDFDSGIATTKINPDNKPVRGYYQNNFTPPSPGFPTGSTINRVPPSRWVNYQEPTWLTGAVEVPPLPPVASNSNPKNKNTDISRGTTPNTNPPSYTHHLIRDFMFLDAVVNNATSDIPPGASSVTLPTGPGKYTVTRIDLVSPSDDDAQLDQYTRGASHVDSVTSKYLVNSATVRDNNNLLMFNKDNDVQFTALLYELTGIPQKQSPDWIGVAVPKDRTVFTNVIIYFHPSTAQPGALYSPDDYPNKTGLKGTNWKELFAYVDRLGSQLAGGILQGGSPDQIVIFPFMRDNNLSDAGILPDQWYFVVRDILDDIFVNGA